MDDTAFAPDFIIAGAMKSGTTSIHYALNQHPKIYIPNKEIHFWDADDFLEHPDFSFFSNNEWFHSNVDNGSSRAWYKDQFSDAPDGSEVFGEDSTGYVSSLLASRRIAKECPNTKVIIMLRDPADRAYSQYWHMLRTGRVTRSFEKTIQREPWKVLPRSVYTPGVRGFLEYCGKQNVRVVSFEAFIDDPGETIRQFIEWLGLDLKGFPDDVFDKPKNSAKIPASSSIECMANRLIGYLISPQYTKWHLARDPKGHFLAKKIFRKAYRLVNPLVSRRPKPMLEKTRRVLDEYFFNINEGLSGLVEYPIDEKWYKSKTR